MDVGQIRKQHPLTAAQVVNELIALCVVESTHIDGVEIRVRIRGNHAEIEDTGRGMRLEPDAGDAISHAERALTSIYPVQAADEAVDRLLRDRVWGVRGCLGPALANASCESFEFVSRRGGEEWAQAYRRGVPIEPARRIGPADRTGTSIRIVTAAPIDAAEVEALARAVGASLFVEKDQ